MVLVEKVASLANKADYYVDPSGEWWKINDCVPHAGWFEIESKVGPYKHRIKFEHVTLKSPEAFYLVEQLGQEVDN